MGLRPVSIGVTLTAKDRATGKVLALRAAIQEAIDSPLLLDIIAAEHDHPVLCGSSPRVPSPANIRFAEYVLALLRLRALHVKVW